MSNDNCTNYSIIIVNVLLYQMERGQLVHLRHTKKELEMKKLIYRCCICGTEKEGIGYDPSDYYMEQKTSRCC